MVKGFEIITQPLTEYETDTLLPIFINCLSRHIGKETSISSRQIVRKMKSHNYRCTDVNVRRVVNHIRINSLVPNLLATSNGYYVSDDIDEVHQYIESLRQREAAIRSVRKSMEARVGFSTGLF